MKGSYSSGGEVLKLVRIKSQMNETILPVWDPIAVVVNLKPQRLYKGRYQPNQSGTNGNCYQ